MTAELQYDVFLSHNSADKPRVRRLAERMRAANLHETGFGLQPSDFGLPPKAARVGLVCPAKATWRRWKRSTFGRGNLSFRDPPNAGRRFIPLELANCAIEMGGESNYSTARQN